jgi:hypothetical protein
MATDAWSRLKRACSDIDSFHPFYHLLPQTVMMRSWALACERDEQLVERVQALIAGK